jgi:hypothetical protein
VVVGPGYQGLSETWRFTLVVAEYMAASSELWEGLSAFPLLLAPLLVLVQLTEIVMKSRLTTGILLSSCCDCAHLKCVAFVSYVNFLSGRIIF